MRLSFTPPITVSAFALAGLLACHSDAVSPPSYDPAATTQLGTSSALSDLSSGGNKVLVVDDDRTDCPNADFTSIQAAVTAADEGSTILVCAGTYREQVTITKHGLRLLAKGKPGDVVLDGLGAPSRFAGFFLNGGHDNLIEGFFLRNYHEGSIVLRSSNRNRIRQNTTTAADHDGIQLNLSSNDNVVEHNVVRDNPAVNACGINVAGGSQRNVVRHNLAMRNEWGIQIIGPTTLDNEIFHNEVVDNRGNGIRNVFLASGTIIEGNRAFRNGLTPGFITGAFASGIRIANGAGIAVRRNHAFDNLLFDLRNDAGPGATFDNNHCRTSSPPGLCEHTEGASKD
ncbi:MAG TPA: right-handed parallel beta-helix repeat-containing protein [Gemmatimonadaceae bacterium]|nr:right-handed parallel beta-helix repeat-containing protein [Gemmatimonadaceae bacterium]